MILEQKRKKDVAQQRITKIAEDLSKMTFLTTI